MKNFNPSAECNFASGWNLNKTDRIERENVVGSKGATGLSPGGSADLRFIYTCASVILGVIIALSVIFPDISEDDETQYYFFLAHRFQDAYLYTGDKLEIVSSPRGYKENPVHIFNNRLLFLYHGYVVRIKTAVPRDYELSFDVYPERFFKKLYSLDGKIISFGIDLSRSERGILALEYYLDLTGKNTSTVKFILKENGTSTLMLKNVDLRKEFSQNSFNRMRFKIICADKETSFYINDRKIAGLITGDSEGVFNFIKYPGSQFQMDNLKIVDLNSGREAVNENFDKYPAFFDIAGLLFPHKKILFTGLFVALFFMGFILDLIFTYVERLYSFKFLWLGLVLPQALLLLSLNHLCSSFLSPGTCAVFAIAGAKIFYAGLKGRLLV